MMNQDQAPDQEQDLKDDSDQEMEGSAADAAADTPDTDSQQDDPGAEVVEDQQFLLDQLQRARAELDNFRRRTLEERAIARKRTISDVIRNFLPVLDGLSAAQKASDDGSDGDGGIRDGLRMISDKLDVVLKELGIEVVAAVGEDFDPEVHEAMLQVDQPDARNGEVVEEIERGYRCGDHLIRAARVVVARTEQASEGA